MKMMSEVIKFVMEKIAATDGYKKNWIHLHWKDVVGKEAGKHSVPRRMEKGMLFVKVDSSAWTYSLFIRKNELVKKINSMFGSSIVTDIKYQAGEIEAETRELKKEAGQMLNEQSQGRYRTKSEQQVIDFLRKKSKKKAHKGLRGSKMYLHIGSAVTVSTDEVVFIIEWTPKAKERNKINVNFFEMAEENGQVIDISEGKAKSLVIMTKHKIYLSPIAKQTLRKRCSRKVFAGG